MGFFAVVDPAMKPHPRSVILAAFIALALAAPVALHGATVPERSAPANAPSTQPAIVLTITAKGHILRRSQVISEEAAIKIIRHAGATGRTVTIRADSRVRSAVVMRILDSVGPDNRLAVSVSGVQ